MTAASLLLGSIASMLRGYGIGDDETDHAISTLRCTIHGYGALQAAEGFKWSADPETFDCIDPLPRPRPADHAPARRKRRRLAPAPRCRGRRRRGRLRRPRRLHRLALGKKYPQAARVWEQAWDDFTPFLAFSPPVREMLCTASSIENLSYQLRKVTKARGHFPSDDAVVKLLWLAIINIGDKRAREREARR